jgi:carboxyl-terminal processing protease
MDLRFITNMPRYRLVLWILFLGALLFFIFQMRNLPGGAQRGPAPKGFELYDALLRLIRNDYLEERDPGRTAEGAYRGLVNSLDPISAYLDKGLAARYLARKPGEAETGLVIFKRYGTFPQVLGVVDGSPAAEAGLRPGDLLSAIDGRNTLSMSLLETDLLLRAGDGEPVEVKVLRGNATLEPPLARAVLFPKPFTFSRPAGGPAVLKIHYLSDSLVPGLRKEAVPALRNGKTPVVLDLRDCREGDVEGALALANIFVKAGVVGRLEKKGGDKQDLACPDDAPLAKTPIAVWVNPATMGPGEIVAGVLQEVRKAKVVGFPTLGLAGQREAFALDDGSLALLTSAVFSLPSGRSLWGEGLEPDVLLTEAGAGEKAYLERTLPLFPPQ